MWDFLFHQVTDVVNADHIAFGGFDGLISCVVQLAQNVHYAVVSIAFAVRSKSGAIRVQWRAHCTVSTSHHVGADANKAVALFDEQSGRSTLFGFDAVHNGEIAVDFGRAEEQVFAIDTGCPQFVGFGHQGLHGCFDFGALGICGRGDRSQHQTKDR